MFLRLLNTLAFWLLTGLAFVFFFVAVIKPPLDEYRSHVRTEQQMQQAVRSLEQTVERNDNAIRLLEHDRQMACRKAIELLNYTWAAGRAVPISPITRSAATVPALVEPPGDEAMLLAGRSGVTRVADRLDEETGRKLDDPRFRRRLLLLAAASIGLAVIFFGVPPPRRKPAPDEPA